MISHPIKLRTECTSGKLSYYIFRFFKKGNFVSRYNSIQLYFHMEDNSIIPVGRNYMLDINSELEVKSYRFYLMQHFTHNFKDNSSKIVKIVFNYVKVSKKEYLNHIKTIQNNPNY